MSWLPEGVNRISDLERDDDAVLRGRVQDSSGTDWEGEILDEREEESFAWQSSRGSDCAGLITFHELGDRLTRIELSLDVVPADPRQALALGTRLADRRTAADLRRFKSRLELINPDLYDDSTPGR
ncbi:MAG: hypothetical protein M3016_00135 [Actinomycetota bacterium]|nr:hypothetical protein [Actinomycetota bacterium]